MKTIKVCGYVVGDHEPIVTFCGAEKDICGYVERVMQTIAYLQLIFHSIVISEETNSYCER